MLTPDKKGAIAEAAIVLAASKLGITVLRPSAEGTRYDLVFDLGGRFLRVQCKSAVHSGGVIAVPCFSSRRCADGFLKRRYTREEIDAVAAYCPELDRSFLLPLDAFRSQTYIQLRVVPTRNKQQLRINWADDFDFAATLRRTRLGAIAQLGERRHGMPEVTGSSPVGSTSQ